MPTRGDLTRTAVLALLGVDGPLSRSELARRLGVSAATITAVTRELLERNAVHEVEFEASTGGRPAQLLGVTGNAGRAIGVKVAPDHYAVVEARLDGSLVDAWRGDFDAAHPGAADELVRLVAGIVADRADGEGPLLGVGMAVPGSVDDQAGGVVDAPTLGWRQLALGRLLRSATGLPVLMENDVSAVAVAERIYGRGRQHRDFLVVTIGAGVGAGLIVDGSLYRGARGGAGEFGHVPVQLDGPACACGSNGCLEALIGEPALLATARRRRVIRGGDTLAVLERKATSGHAGALEVYAVAGTLLGQAVAGLVNVLDPEMVVVIGEGTSAWEHWRPTFEQTLRGHLLPARRGVPVDVEEWDDYSWALGAAALVLAAPYDATGTAGREGELVRARLRGARTP
jgi:predicted NBD/HSP70 family sugar kinase